MKNYDQINSPHIEKCKSITESYKYVTKEDTRVDGPWEFGENTIINKGGDKKSIKAVEKAIQKKKTVGDLMAINLHNKDEVFELTPY